MEVHFTPEQEAAIARTAASTGTDPEAFVKDAALALVDQLAETREMLDSRYDDLKSGRVQPIDGEEFFEQLRRREDELNHRAP